jgi:TonB family protein
MSRFLFVFCSLTLIPHFAIKQSAAQVASPNSSQGEVVINTLSPPTYPPMARQAHITGDVRLLLAIGRNGSIESAAIVSGHPMLQEAALESARRSQFECRGCSASATSYEMVYTFNLAGKCCTPTGETANNAREKSPQLGVTQSENHVTVVAEPACICDADIAIVASKVRSAKCLYLWRCVHRP